MPILTRTTNLLPATSGISMIFCSGQSSPIVPVISRYLHTRLRAVAIQPEAWAPAQGLRQLSAEELIGILTFCSLFVSAR